MSDDTDKEFLNYLQNQSCNSCGKCINLPELIAKSECKDVIVINYHDNAKGNQNVLFCSRVCFNDYDDFGEIHCVVCDQPRKSPKYDLKIKFEKLGGWLSVRAVCSEECQVRLQKESFQNPDFEFEMSCWYCKKTSKTPLQRCSRCKVAHYCDVTCQTSHWKEHRTNCIKE